MYWNTVTSLLRETLIEMMSASVFESFRLVGGTNLSFQWGHRMSVDIDLFTDAEYGTVDLNNINKWLRGKFAYVYTSNPGVNPDLRIAIKSLTLIGCIIRINIPA